MSQVVIEAKRTGGAICQKVLILIRVQCPSSQGARVELLVDFDRHFQRVLLVLRVDVGAVYPFKIIDVDGGCRRVNSEALQAVQSANEKGQFEGGVE